MSSTLALAVCLLASAVSALTMPTVRSAPASVRSAPPTMLFRRLRKNLGVPAPVDLASLAALSEAEVVECQENWAAAIAACSKIYKEGGDYIGAAAGAAADLYGYGHTEVLFKPTKAAVHPYRPTAEEAMSYFVGGNVVEGGYDEDAGFAINGGKGWEKVEFHNHRISLNGPTATAMGYYVFTDATSRDEVTVEYTFGYKRCSDGKPRIFLHHSSVPFQKDGSGQGMLLAPLSEVEVLDCQAKWASAIASISRTYLENTAFSKFSRNKAFIREAERHAGELYGYGFGKVLFKPTKASDVPFRPTAQEAMSYFVGGSVVEGGYDEDAGFAINGGKGWEKVEFHNHKVTLLGTTAIAMGYYIFTDATTKDEVRVEYTFGYKRCSDGKPRIFLHHSSVPYSGGGADTRATWLEAAEKLKNKFEDVTGIDIDGDGYVGEPPLPVPTIGTDTPSQPPPEETAPPPAAVAISDDDDALWRFDAESGTEAEEAAAAKAAEEAAAAKAAEEAAAAKAVEEAAAAKAAEEAAAAKAAISYQELVLRLEQAVTDNNLSARTALADLKSQQEYLREAGVPAEALTQLLENVAAAAAKEEEAAAAA